MIAFLQEYWYLIIIGLVVVVVGIKTIYNFFSTTTKEERLNAVKEWLVYAVALAEKELGSGTGALKLREVYDQFLTKFPSYITKAISFATFSKLVDEALVTFKNMLKTNEAVKNYVEGKDEETK